MLYLTANRISFLYPFMLFLFHYKCIYIYIYISNIYFIVLYLLNSHAWLGFNREEISKVLPQQHFISTTVRQII